MWKNFQLGEKSTAECKDEVLGKKEEEQVKEHRKHRHMSVNNRS